MINPRWERMGWLGLILAHTLTPFVPFAFPIRIAVTAAMAAKKNWIKVVLVANTASALCLMIQYLIYQQLGSAHWSRALEQYPSIRMIMHSMDAHMFLALMGLNISPIPETILPLIASMRHYSFGLFGLAMFLGRLTHTVPMALAGLGFTWFNRKVL